MRNKIFYLANIRLPTEKAHGNQIMNMCQAFAERGMEVELWVSNRKTPIVTDPFEYYGVKKIFKIRRIWCLDWVHFGRLGFLIESSTFVHSALLKALFYKGIFYTRDEMMALHLKSIGKPVVWEVHTALKNNFLTRWLLRSKIPIIAISQGLKKYLEKLGSRNILAASDGVSLDKFNKPSLLLKNSKTVFGYIGKYKTMGESKGVDELVDAFLRLNDEQTELRVIGLNPGEKIAHGPRIMAFEHLPAREIPDHLMACDVLVMNYPRTTHYGNFMSPLKLFEYMAAEKPIILPNLDSLKEILSEDEAYFFEAGNVESLCETMRKVLDNPVEAENKARLARQKVEDYTWSNRARRILDFIHA